MRSRYVAIGALLTGVLAGCQQQPTSTNAVDATPTGVSEPATSMTPMPDSMAIDSPGGAVISNDAMMVGDAMSSPPVGTIAPPLAASPDDKDDEQMGQMPKQPHPTRTPDR